MSENTERERLIDRRKMVELVLENPYKFDNATLSAQIIMALKEFDAEVAALSRPVPDDSESTMSSSGPFYSGLGAPVVPVTEGVDPEAAGLIERAEEYAHAGSLPAPAHAFILALTGALRSRLSPPTREAIAETLYAVDNWGVDARGMWKDGVPGPWVYERFFRLADAALAALSSPETEGEKN